MILVDTSIWVRHLRQGDAHLIDLPPALLAAPDELLIILMRGHCLRAESGMLTPIWSPRISTPVTPRIRS